MSETAGDYYYYRTSITSGNPWETNSTYTPEIKFTFDNPNILTKNMKKLIEEQKGEDKMVYLSDLVIYFGMTKKDLEEVKKIVDEKDWKERLTLFMLCHAVMKEGLTFEGLGYEEEE